MNTENQKTWVRNRDQTENMDWEQKKKLETGIGNKDITKKTGLGTENKGLKTGTAAFFERNHACGCQQVFSHPNLY